MNLETAAATVRFIEAQAAALNPPYLGVSIFGGEPLLNAPVVLHLVRSLDAVRTRQSTDLRILLFSNGTILHDQLSDLMCGQRHMEYHVGLDGSETIHDRFRLDRRGLGTYRTVAANIERLLARNVVVVAESVVTHPYRYIELLQEYDQLGIRYGFIQDEVLPVRGKGGTSSLVVGFDPELWALQYGNFCDHYFERIVQRTAPLVDPLFGVVKCFLRDESDPPLACTAGTGQVSISSNGDIYACNQLQEIEGFRLGNVFEGKDELLYQRFTELMLSEGLVVQQPRCGACEIRGSCRGGCYARNYVRSGSIGGLEDEAVCDYRRTKASIHRGFVRKMIERFPSYPADVLGRNYAAYFPALMGATHD